MTESEITIPHASCITPVGSRVTCNPRPTNTDRDWLVLFDAKDAQDFEAWLVADGWTLGGSDIPDDCNTVPEPDRFHSFTKGYENIIATSSVAFHKRFLAATSVAKHLNLMSKEDRIALFQAVLYGNEMLTWHAVQLPPMPAEMTEAFDSF